MAQVKDKKLMLLPSHGKPDLCFLPLISGSTK
jgi:hypothetical protein